MQGGMPLDLDVMRYCTGSFGPINVLKERQVFLRLIASILLVAYATEGGERQPALIVEQALPGTQQETGFRSISGTAALPGGPAAASALLFPHYAQGGGYQTLFTLNNPSAAATNVLLEFISPSGTAAGSTNVFVPARGSARYAMTGSTLTVGWVRVSPSPVVDLAATETIQLFNGATLVMEASVLPAEQDLALRLPITQGDGFSTGFAVMNGGSDAVTVTATFIDAIGAIVGSAPIALGPWGQQPKFVHELFPGTEGIHGTLELSAASAIAAVALRQHSSGIFSTLPVSTAGTEVFFSPNAGTASRIVQEIGRARRTIDIAIYSFTRNEIADALIAARSRGVAIRILADSSQVASPGSEIARLEAAGFQLKRSIGGNGGIMHHKYAIFDGRLLLTGSYNWSTNAEQNSDENAVFLRNAALIAAFQSNFDSMWSTR